ncbi:MULTISPECIES: SDR family NAD(P)-dependent oxidoreductase [unclassified Acidisoma]|jgi:NAD(P)-dependent dehydrogenase (short-subunit alcohol dehydrogenase family)|uniref:SDR family NAD(P)-dependent oxidoreductase n=1 Tax=unclassified Acidisoma TaxID=2634065 RepID=UPI00131C6589|nr:MULTISPECIES: SDR family NAD(P)-dependent oxidoreductase [unclassified Acidisoma]
MPQIAKIALVTGANQGIGFETVRQLAEKGVTVLLAGRSLAAAESAAAKLHTDGLVNVSPVKLDVTEAADRTATAQLIQRQFGRLDILVNNAGMTAPQGTLMERLTINTTEEELQLVFETNLFAVLRLTSEVLPLLRESGGGRIVNVSSILGSLNLHATQAEAVSYNKRFAYNASKAALNLFTIQLAQELDDTDIKVNSVHPGWVRTRSGTDLAPMEPSEGAKTSVAAALMGADGPTGTFFHFSETIPW